MGYCNDMRAICYPTEAHDHDPNVKKTKECSQISLALPHQSHFTSYNEAERHYQEILSSLHDRDNTWAEVTYSAHPFIYCHELAKIVEGMSHQMQPVQAPHICCTSCLAQPHEASLGSRVCTVARNKQQSKILSPSSCRTNSHEQ